MKENFFKALACILAFCLFSGCSPAIAPEPEFRVIGQSVTAGESNNYFYNNLSDVEKRGYDKIKKAAADFEDYIVFDDTLSDFQIIKLFNLVYTQENGIFWLSEIASASQKNNSLKINFRYNSGDTKAMQAKLDENLRAAVKNAPENDNYGKIKYIHDYIIKNCNFTESGKNTNSAYGALIDGKAQCEGYAFAFGLMAKKLGFECITVTGTSEKGDSHAWNKIFSDGNWYNVDCTWDDPVISFDNPGYIRYFYMCVPDRDIDGITHFEDKEYVYSPAAISNANNYFTKENLLFSDAAAAEVTIYDKVTKAILTKSTEIEIRFDVKTAYDETLSYLYDSGGLTGIIDRVNSEQSAGIKTAYHSKDDNLYIIHISLVYK
ncbi:MAG: hypothetical protein LBL80_05725 [Ruminococcus sp.]|jgi:hypothetical protein|nr:hypothetical protein [Ruminococcus sp.]